MNEMSIEEMKALKEKANPEAAGKNEVMELAKSVGQGLEKLIGMLNESSAATDQDKAAGNEILSQYVSLVENNLTQSPGQDPEQEAEPMVSEVPVNAGVSGKPIGPQSRN